MPPLGEKDGPLQINFTYFYFQIIEILDSQSTMSLQFGLWYTWRDSRVKFFNLDMNSNKSLSVHDSEQLWRPLLTMYKTTDENMVEDVSFRNGL